MQNNRAIPLGHDMPSDRADETMYFVPADELNIMLPFMPAGGHQTFMHDGSQPIFVPAGNPSPPTFVPVGSQPIFAPAGNPPAFVPAGSQPEFVPTASQPQFMSAGNPPTFAPAGNPAQSGSAPRHASRRCFRCNSGAHVLSQCPHPRAPGRKEPFDGRRKKRRLKSRSQSQPSQSV